VALGLVAVVAMAANGAVWSTQHDAGARSLPHAVVVGALVVAGGLGVLLILAALATTRAGETPEQRRRRWATAVSFIVAIALISIIRLSIGGLHANDSSHSSGGSGNAHPVGPTGAGTHAAPATWLPLVFVALGVVALFLTTQARRRPRVPPEGVAAEDETIALLDASLDDLRREPDPRRAVVAAYARMERRLAARGFARRPAETPTEYLQRALSPRASGAPTVGVEPLRELTELAELARFSAAPIDEAMRARAIAALEHLRAELRTADVRVAV
jgi:hypothetical protein